MSAGRLYRVADLKRAAEDQAAYFASPLIKPLARRGAERALASAFRAELATYRRVKTSRASIFSLLVRSAALSAAAAAESPLPFSHGNFASIPRVTGSPSTPPKSIGQNPFGTTSA